MIEKLVSVIIPLYNAEKTILKSLNSVLNQTYKNLEIIIVNDGSTDNSEKIVRKFKNENKIEMKIINQKNGGPSVARNTGIRNSNGEYLAFLDSDDSWVYSKIEMQLRCLKNNGLKMIGCNSNNKNLNKVKIITFKELLFKNKLTTSSVLLKKQILKEVGLFNENKKYSEDYELWLRIASKFKFKIGLLEEHLVNYGNGKRRFGQSGLSGNLKGMLKGELDNYSYLKSNKNISYVRYLLCINFSKIKYLRRKILCKVCD